MEIEERIRKIQGYKTWSLKKKVDALLEIDALFPAFFDFFPYICHLSASAPPPHSSLLSNSRNFLTLIVS